MNNYLLIIKDQNEVFKERTNAIYCHEDAAYNYLASKYQDLEDNMLASVELATKGYLVVSVADSYTMLILPTELNNDQKQYLLSKKEYLKNNIDCLAIIDLIYQNDKYFQCEYIAEKLINEFEELFERKIEGNGKTLVKK